MFDLGGLLLVQDKYNIETVYEISNDDPNSQVDW